MKALNCMLLSVIVPFETESFYFETYRKQKKKTNKQKQANKHSINNKVMFNSLISHTYQTKLEMLFNGYCLNLRSSGFSDS